MSSRIYVSTIEASYFETHILGCSPSPPVTGTYTIGDVFISSIQQNDVFGWVCVEAGSPGVWKIICDVTLIKDNIQENTTNINKLLEFMMETKDEIKGINTKNNNQDSQINQLIKDLESLNKLVTDSDNILTEVVHENSAEIQKLAAEVANNKQGINKNKEDITNINDQINNINNSMNTVSSQVITNTSDINKLKEDINDTNEVVDSILSDMEKIYDLQQGVSNNNNAIRKLESDVSTNKILINGIQQDTAGLIGDVENNTNDIGGLQKEVSNLQETVNNNSKDMDNIQNEIDEIKDILSDDSEQELDGLINIRKDVDANKQEINDLKQGLVDALVNKGVDVDNNTSWLDLFKEMINQLGGNNPDPEEPVDPEPENPDPEEPVDPEPENPESNSISLFKNGVVNNETDFKNLAIGDSSSNITLTNNGIRCATGLYTDKGYFSFTGYTDFTNYECVGFKVYTERADHQPTIGIATTTKSGQYSHSSLDTWEGTDRGSVKIMTNTEPSMYYFDIRDVNEQGYLLFWTGNADDVSESYTYITDIVVYRNGDYYPGDDEPDIGTPCTKITLDPTSMSFTEIDERQQLYVDVLPVNTTDVITWKSSNEAIAIVDSEARVTATGNGSCIITATCGSKSTTCEVTVNAIIPCTFISLDKSNIRFTSKGVTETLNVAVTPDDTTDTISWRSDNTNVATVNNGIVTSVNDGECNIYVSCGSQQTGCNVSVVTPIICTGLSLNKSTLALAPIGASEALIATPTPTNTTDVITWKSSNAGIASVNDNGVVMAIGNGSCTITATCGNISKSCSVTVNTTIACTALSLDVSSIDFTELNETRYVKATPTPTNTTDTITWKSSNTGVATVDEGNITSVGKGSCTITATCGSKSVTCSVSVKEVIPCNGIIVSPNTVTLGAGESATITVSLSPSDTTENISSMSINSDSSFVTITRSTVDQRTMNVTIKMSDKNPTSTSINFDYNGFSEECVIIYNYDDLV